MNKIKACDRTLSLPPDLLLKMKERLVSILGCCNNITLVTSDDGTFVIYHTRQSIFRWEPSLQEWVCHKNRIVSEHANSNRN